MHRRVRKGLLIAQLVAVLTAASLPAAAHQHDPLAHHPIRVAAYVLHPVGVLLDTLLIRPAHWLVSREPWKTLFGHTD